MRAGGVRSRLVRTLGTTRPGPVIAVGAKESADQLRAWSQLSARTSIALALTDDDLRVQSGTQWESLCNVASLAETVILPTREAWPEGVGVIAMPAPMIHCVPPAWPSRGGRHTPGPGFRVAVLDHDRASEPSRLVSAALDLLPPSSEIVCDHLQLQDPSQRQRLHQVHQVQHARVATRTERPARQARSHLRGLDALDAMIRRAHVLALLEGAVPHGEAIALAAARRIPVIAIDSPAHRALLGGDYPGLFPIGDAETLAGRILTAERDPAWYARLVAAMRVVAEQRSVSAERDALVQVVKDLGWDGLQTPGMDPRR